MTNSELLAAISEMFDAKLEARLEPIENRLESLENRLEVLENKVGILETKSDSTERSIASINNTIFKMQQLLENQILPRLQTIESCYLDTYKRYSASADKIQTTIDDVDILKKVVHRHSELLQMTS